MQIFFASCHFRLTTRQPTSIILFVCSLLSCLAPAAFAQSGASSQANTQKGPIISVPTTSKKRTGDLDALLAARVIRISVPYSKTLYYTVKGVQYGIAYETGKAFEAYLNKKYRQKSKNLKILVIFMVTSREKASQLLNDGFTDILAGSVAITPERQKIVDFSEPTVSGIDEIVVTGPQSPTLTSLDDLSGKEVFARKSSSYLAHMERLNDKFKNEKKQLVTLRAVPEDLGDEDLLEMVNAGLLPTIVVYDWTAKLWNELLPKLQLHADIPVATGDSLGWAVRKNSPKLLADINDFFKTRRQGTAFGQQLLAKYTGSTYMLKQAVSESGMKRFQDTAETFRKFSSQYNVDYLLMMAEGYQESGLNQNVRSPVGAIGVMQLMPDTGKQMNVGDITQETANIHAGIKYFRSMVDKLYANEPIDDLNKVLFTFASYNCGPNRVKQLRAEAAQKGLDPSVWINNVEVIAAARVGVETVTYVSNIYKYYVAYKLIAAQEEQRQKAKESIR